MRGGLQPEHRIDRQSVLDEHVRRIREFFDPAVITAHDLHADERTRLREEECFDEHLVIVRGQRTRMVVIRLEHDRYERESETLRILLSDAR